MAPRMLKYLLDIVPLRDIAVEHTAYKVDALVADCVWHPQVTVHYLVDTVKRVLLVNDGVKQDAKSPHILLSPAVGLSSQDFGSGVI
jgi:hypothetical protein